VKINDRGPYVQGRHLDLSQAAAKQIGLTKKGVAKVKIEAKPPHQGTK
jgi:rare lipoprotein A